MILPAAAPFGFKAGGMETQARPGVERVLEQPGCDSAFAQWRSEQSASGGMVLSSRPAFRAGFMMPPTVGDPLFA